MNPSREVIAAAHTRDGLIEPALIRADNILRRRSANHRRDLHARPTAEGAIHVGGEFANGRLIALTAIQLAPVFEGFENRLRQIGFLHSMLLLRLSWHGRLSFDVYASTCQFEAHQ
jgi:hypothetical protein